MLCRCLTVLMWKHLMVRKRLYFKTPFELLSPLIFFGLLIFFKNFVESEQSSYKVNDQPVIRTNDELGPYHLGSPSRVMYFPETEFTNILMEEVGKQLNLRQRNKLSSTKLAEPMVTHVISKREDMNARDWLLFDRNLGNRGIYPFANLSEISDLDPTLQNDEAVVDFTERDDTPEKLTYKILTKNSFFKNSLEATDGRLEPHQSFGTDYHIIMRLQWAIDTSFIKMLTGSNVTEKLALQEFPGVVRTTSADDFDVAALCTLVISMSWLSLVMVFIYLMVRMMEERYTGIQELIKLVGVSSNIIDISHFLNVLPTGIIYCVVGTILLKCTSSPVVPHTGWPIICIGLMLHFLSVITVAIPASYIAKRTTYTTTLATCVFIMIYLPHSIIAEKSKNRTVNLAIGMLPHVPNFWLWFQIGERERYGKGLGFSDLFTSFSPHHGSVGAGFILMVVQTLLFSALGWYMARVRPGEYGQALPWNFLCKKQYWNRNEVAPDTLLDDEETPMSKETKFFEKVPKNLEAGIRIENVTKIFPHQKALNNVSFDVYKGEITVLLGHNGAGKTTLMSIITGIMNATKGRVLVNGMDTSRASVEHRSQIGMCTQHNLFFENFTILEHTMFFTLLKGGSFKEARIKSLELLKSLNLEDKANMFSDALSGGMKRRAQLACALAGGSSVLILDEPTSGLDVETRRELWDLLLSLRGSRTVLLTTHFMEEADALGDRVAALHQGRLRCHATPMYLKKAIGTGYRLTFTTRGPPRESEVTAAVASNVPDATLKEKTINSLSYNLPASASSNFAELFEALEERKHELGIETIGVGVSTLDEVFMRLCSDTDTTFSEDELDRTGAVTAREPAFERVAGCALYARQFAYLFIRQLLYIWDKKISFLLLQVLLPIVFICAFTAISNNEETKKLEGPDKLSLDLDIYNPLNTRRVLYDVTDPAVNMRALSDAWAQVDFIDTRNVSGVVLRASEKDVVESSKYLVGIQINDTHAKAMFTTSYRHAAPIALNLLSNALATRYLSRADGRTFRTYYQPVRSPTDILSIKDYKIHRAKEFTSCMTYVTFLVFIFLATILNDVNLPCVERVNGARHIHLMCGCPAILHWTVTLVFHTSVCFLFLVCSAAVAAVTIDSDRTIDQPDFILMMMLVLVIGALAFHALTYLMSWFFQERAAAGVLLAIVILGIITAFIGAVTLIKEDKLQWYWQVGMWCGIPLPPHHLCLALVKSVNIARLNALCELNRDKCANEILISFETGFDQEKCCRGEKMLSYMSWAKNAPGQELVYLSALFLIYMTLVLLTQRGVTTSLLDKIFNNAYRKSAQKKVSADDMVRAEAIYVEKQIALPKQQIANTNNAILINNVHKNYKKCCGSCNAVKGVTFSVKKGECFGLLGVNGAGKSTTFKMLTAEECTTMGNIYANGFFLSDRAQYLRSLGYCPQFFGLDDFLTGRHNLTLILTFRGLNANDVSKEVASWIEVVGLEKYMNRKVSEYSGGCKRRLAAAAALSVGAPLTLLDEPTAGVDVSARRRVWSALLRSLKQGRAVIITSHSMDEMEALCSRIAILSDGVVRALGTPSELRAHYAAGHAVIIKVTHVSGKGPSTSDRDEVDHSNNVEKLKSDVTREFNCTLKDEHSTMLHYHINETMRYSDLFKTLEDLKSKHPDLVEDYSVTETTLEEVFLSIAKEQQEAAERAKAEQEAKKRPKRRPKQTTQRNNVV